MHNPIVMIVALVLLFFLARSAWNMHRAADLASAKQAQTNMELEKLRANQESLSARIDSLSTPVGLEAELRTKYRAVKDGESVAVIVNTGDTTTTPVEASAKNSGWFDRVLSWFGL